MTEMNRQPAPPATANMGGSVRERVARIKDHLEIAREGRMDIVAETSAVACYYEVIHLLAELDAPAAADASDEKAGITQAERAQRTSEHPSIGMREALEAALTAAYRKGAQDGHRYGPVVAHWDYPPLHARALFSSTGDERREAPLSEDDKATAEKLVARINQTMLAGWPPAIERAARSLLHADGGEKP